MAELYDDLYYVIKGNSGLLSANDGVFTEIFDFQIPRNYCVRIRKIFVDFQIGPDQVDQQHIRYLTALVLDPDDETSVQIPTFTIDHDVAADFQLEIIRFEEDTTPNGISIALSEAQEQEFPEELDMITVRNARFNSMVTGSAAGGENPSQVRMKVYFTYEKVSSSLYEKLLGIR